MPKTKSAKRALRRALRNWYFNELRRRKIKARIKEFLKALKIKDKTTAKEKLNLVYKEIDKATKRFMHKNKAARLKSKYALLFNQIFEKENN